MTAWEESYVNKLAFKALLIEIELVLDISCYR